ncbi:MAG: GatB/YqeY domain-containing protein [Mariprofundales bacterium]
MLQQITSAMKQAMKSKDKPRLSTIRMLRAALKDREIAQGKALDDAAVIQVVTRMVKQRKDAATQFADANRADLAEKEQFEIGVLSQWLPQQLDEDGIATAVTDACATLSASSMRDMGKVMGVLQKQLAGRADMSQVSAAVKQQLGS